MKGEESLEEGQLHLQAMLLAVSLGTIEEHTVGTGGNQFLRCFPVNFHVAQWRGVIVGLRVHRSPVEPFVVTGPEQENPLVCLVLRECHIGRSRHIA